MLQPDLGTSLVFGAILAGMLWMSGASLRWLAILAVGGVAMVPVAWTYLLRDYQKERLRRFLDPHRTSRAPATSCTRRRSRSVRADSSARA